MKINYHNKLQKSEKNCKISQGISIWPYSIRAGIHHTQARRRGGGAAADRRRSVTWRCGGASSFFLNINTGSITAPNTYGTAGIFKLLNTLLNKIAFGWDLTTKKTIFHVFVDQQCSSRKRSLLWYLCFFK